MADTSLKARSIRTWPSVRAIDHLSQGRLSATIASARYGHCRAQRLYRVRPEVEARAGVHVLVGADPLEASQIDILAMRQA
jgi:hypothetical protein